MACSSLTQRPADAVVGASDPRVQDVGVGIFEKGGNAADAMVAMMMTSGVVTPSRSGLGGGGICQILDPNEGRVKTLNFLYRRNNGMGMPALAKGAFSLQKYGKLRWQDTLDDSIRLARQDVVVSEQLAKDILNAKGLPLEWKKLKKGDKVSRKDLAATLLKISEKGSGVFYNGEVSEGLSKQGFSAEDLKSYRATFMDSMDVSTAAGRAYFPNPSAISTLGYNLWNALENPEKEQEALQTVLSLREKNIAMEEASYGESFFAADKDGLIVVCSVSNGGLFGNKKLMKEGFFAANPFSREKSETFFFNILQTNPDVTDAMAVVAGVGSHAWPDALSLMRDDEEALEISDQRKEELDNFISLKCAKGYPNQSMSCRENQNIVFVYTGK